MHAYHTDSELICAYRKGNERAFETLLNRYQQGVFLKINFVVRNEEIANDLFQDVWIKVVQILKSGRYVEREVWAVDHAHRSQRGNRSFPTEPKAQNGAPHRGVRHL